MLLPLSYKAHLCNCWRGPTKSSRLEHRRRTLRRPPWSISWGHTSGRWRSIGSLPSESLEQLEGRLSRPSIIWWCLGRSHDPSSQQRNVRRNHKLLLQFFIELSQHQANSGFLERPGTPPYSRSSLQRRGGFQSDHVCRVGFLPPQLQENHWFKQPH